jgi:sugar/nucleoside kinase (ribokinase family)
MDIHSLTLGRNRSGNRYLRTPKWWREYIKQADIIQTNLVELEVLNGRKLRHAKEIIEFGNYLLSLGPDVLLVTLGDKGALMIFKEEGKVKLEKSTGIRVRGFKDTTGCGDVFSAGFLINYLNTKDLIHSLDFANRMAAEKCKLSGVERVAKSIKDNRDTMIT